MPRLCWSFCSTGVVSGHQTLVSVRRLNVQDRLPILVSDFFHVLSLFLFLHAFYFSSCKPLTLHWNLFILKVPRFHLNFTWLSFIVSSECSFLPSQSIRIWIPKIELDLKSNHDWSIILLLTQQLGFFTFTTFEIDLINCVEFILMNLMINCGNASNHLF